jgi:hypothetical protein
MEQESAVRDRGSVVSKEKILLTGSRRPFALPNGRGQDGLGG